MQDIKWKKLQTKKCQKPKFIKFFLKSFKKVFLFGVRLQLDSEVIPNAACKLKTINRATNFS